MDVDGHSSRQPGAPKKTNILNLPTNVLIKVFSKACPSPYDNRLLYVLSMGLQEVCCSPEAAK